MKTAKNSDNDLKKSFLKQKSPFNKKNRLAQLFSGEFATILMIPYTRSENDFFIFTLFEDETAKKSPSYAEEGDFFDSR